MPQASKSQVGWLRLWCKKLDQPFDEAMILLDEVVEVFTLPQFTRVWQNPFRFEFLESLWRGWVFINPIVDKYEHLC